MAQAVLVVAAEAVATEFTLTAGAEAALMLAANVAGVAFDQYVTYPLLLGKDKAQHPDINDSSFDVGALCPHAYGRVRVPGQVIWARSPIINESESGKGKRKAVKEEITRNLAVAFHRGPITSTFPIKEVYANGTNIEFAEVTSDLVFTPTYYAMTDVVIINDASTTQKITLTVGFANINDVADFRRNLVLGKSFTFTTSNTNMNAVQLDPYAGHLAHDVQALDTVNFRVTFNVYFILDDGSNDDPGVPPGTEGGDPGGTNTPTGVRSQINLAAFTTPMAQVTFYATINDKKYYDSATVYKGDFDQGLDPLMFATLGLLCPAHRGTSYVVFENFKTTTWGGTIPMFEILFETHDAEQGNSLCDMATAFANVMWYNDHINEINLRYLATEADGTSEPFEGIFWMGPVSATQKLQDLAMIGQVNIFEGFETTNNGLYVQHTLEVTPMKRTRPFPAARAIPSTSATCRVYGDLGPIEPKVTRTPIESAPNSIIATYVDADKHNLQNTITHHSATSSSRYASRNDLNLKLPFTLYSEDAQNYVTRMFWDAQLQKDTIELSLPPTFFDLYAGDNFDITLHGIAVKARCVEIDYGSNGAVAVRAVINDTETGAQLVETPPVVVPDDIFGLVTYLTEVPPQSDSDVDKLVIYATVAYSAPFPVNGWGLFLPDIYGNWQQVATFRRSSFLTYTTATLLYGDPEVLDNQNTSIHDVIYMGGPATPGGATIAAEGSYRFVINGEIVGYGHNDGVGLRQLVRGVGSSPAFAVASNTMIISMPENLLGWVRVELPGSYVGRTLQFRTGNVGADPHTMPLRAYRTVTGASLKTPKPYGFRSFRRDGGALEVYCFAGGPRRCDILSSGHITSGEISAGHTPYARVLRSLTQPTPIRVLRGVHMGDGSWKFYYSSVAQRIDFDSATDPTDISLEIGGDAAIDSTSYYTHSGNNNYKD